MSRHHRHRKFGCRTVLASLGLVLSVALLSGCTDSADWVAPTLVQSETDVFETAASSDAVSNGSTTSASDVSSTSNGTESGSADSSGQSDLTIWAAQGSEFSELMLETLELATDLTIEQQVLSVSELQEALESLSADQELSESVEETTEQIGEPETADATEQEFSDTSTSTGDLPDLILGMDESILPTELLTTGGVEQYGTDYVCVLALREYFAANNVSTPTSWDEVLASADAWGLELVDPQQDLSSLAFVTALENSGLWEEAESLVTIVESYPEFQLEVGLDGSPEVQDAVDNALSQPILRIASVSQAQITNNLGTDTPLSVISQTCVSRSLYALAQTDAGQELLNFLLSQSGQNFLEQVFGDDVQESDLLASLS